MMLLPSKPLDTATVDALQNLQDMVNHKTTFIENVKEALRLWENKTEIPFGVVKETLVGLTISDQICNYCEQNEATDIEHIYPKSHFPNRCFNWGNYILACKKCNMDDKNDAFAIFEPAGSNYLVELKRKKLERRTRPATEDGALLSPRAENPMEFLWLNMQPIQNRLIFVPRETDKTTRDYARAHYTIQLLNLNRDQLATSRYQAGQYFISRLQLYAQVKAATDFQALEVATDDFKPINTAIPFATEQSNILKSIKADILHYSHPTVWAEMKRQRSILPKTNALFLSTPEALNW